MHTDNSAHWKVRDRGVDVGHQMEATRSNPRTLDNNLGKIVDELANRRTSVDAGDICATKLTSSP